jgi:hypothetical protein
MFRVAALLTLLLLNACAASSPPLPPVIAKQPEVTPLPASVSRIDPQSSQVWLLKVESYLRKVDELSKTETLK